ncbi:WYL domain-containing protein [Vibrio owensii]|uniref:Uncharacterized protein n=1 Tax=Vibrio owensii CAIM 1854 = LMG 25443 TaxID=1229493 RepID=A0A0C1Z7T0_9VIBR|nr:WYL domain-containing protein [Vibrio owensii]KIF52249.1 hypothetical protein H735_15675 [Vibrio owensii CAIM 1854 = LMG 25443]
MSIEELSFSVRERLQYIEFLLQFRGWLSRSDLVDKFAISAPAATRDFRKYKDIAPENLDFDDSSKTYTIKDSSFKPVFTIRIHEALGKLRNPALALALGLGENESYSAPPRLSMPKLDVLMSLSRSIINKQALRINYLSVKNGNSDRKIVPHSLVDNGLRLHVRAYDYKRKKFCDFVLSRIIKAEQLDEFVPFERTSTLDYQWNRYVRLELVPHPCSENVLNPKTIERDLDMKDGVKVIQVRAAVAGYWLRLWNVDCSKDASLRGTEFHLWLRNHETLYDVESAKLAPK